MTTCHYLIWRDYTVLHRIYFHLLLWILSSVNVIVIPVVFPAGKAAFTALFRVTEIGAFMGDLCHINASHLKCRKKINLKSLKVVTQRVTTQTATSPWMNSVSFTLSLRHNSTKLHPKWLLMTKTLHGKERRKYSIDWMLNIMHWIYWDDWGIHGMELLSL